MWQRFILGVIIFTLYSGSVYSGKIYKVIGKDGKVSFSQYPPEKIDKGAILERVSIKADVGISITSVGSSKYCGSIKLPNDSDSHSKKTTYKLQRLTRSAESWKSNLKRTQETIERDRLAQSERSRRKYQSTSQISRRYGEWEDRNQKNVELAKEYRCAINWAKNTLEGKQDSSPDTEIVRLTGLLETHQQQMIKVCDKEPLFDPTTPVGKANTRLWRECTKSYRDNNDQLHRRIRQLKKQRY
jgi:hypothetical protein